MAPSGAINCSRILCAVDEFVAKRECSENSSIAKISERHDKADFRRRFIDMKNILEHMTWYECP